MMRIETYRLQAFNSATQSENKMHDNEVAKQFGFAGGLVTGVDMFAYMMHQPVAHWGADFLSCGRMEARFLKPVYDSEMLDIEADEEDGLLAIRLISRGEVCATASAALTETVPVVDLDAYPAALPPTQRQPLAEDSFLEGHAYGAAPADCRKDAAAIYQDEVRERDPIYARDSVVHPGIVQRLMNRVLVENARLGPWIHVGGQMQLLAPIAIGDELTARARVTAAYEKKGHRFVEFDAVTLANGTRRVALCHHIAIVQPRKERAAA
jgi:acyl dehydratase